MTDLAAAVNAATALKKAVNAAMKEQAGNPGWLILFDVLPGVNRIEAKLDDLRRFVEKEPAPQPQHDDLP